MKSVFTTIYRRPRESGAQGPPLRSCRPWIPAFAGMTTRSDDFSRNFGSFLVSLSRRSGRQLGHQPDRRSQLLELKMRAQEDGGVVATGPARYVAHVDPRLAQRILGF